MEIRKKDFNQDLTRRENIALYKRRNDCSIKTASMKFDKWKSWYMDGGFKDLIRASYRGKRDRRIINIEKKEIYIGLKDAGRLNGGISSQSIHSAITKGTKASKCHFKYIENCEIIDYKKQGFKEVYLQWTGEYTAERREGILC